MGSSRAARRDGYQPEGGTTNTIRAAALRWDRAGAQAGRVPAEEDADADGHGEGHEDRQEWTLAGTRYWKLGRDEGHDKDHAQAQDDADQPADAWSAPRPR